MARPREFDEGSVLRAAREQFSSTGYAGTSMDGICEATGLGKGSLYGAFGGKRGLFQRVFDEYCTAAVEQARRDLDGPDDEALARLCAHVRSVAAATATDVARRGCLLAKGTAELAEHDPDVAARSLWTFDELERILTADIEACQRHGDVSAAADPRALAVLLLAVLRGIEALGKGGKDEASLHTIADTALALLPRP
jgi:TetR/AcrR family transcriptional regulator, transcriptional repressor for nem operon